MPSTPADTYGLLRAADPGPESCGLHREPAAVRDEGTPAAVRLHPPDRHNRRSCVPEPTSRSCRSHEWFTRRSPPPSEWGEEGISVEVIDLRTVARSTCAPILDSVHKTSRLLIAHEAAVPFGIGAEIAATVAREGFWDLDAPIERIGAAATPPPYAPTWKRPGSPTATTSPPASVAWWPYSPSRGRLPTACVTLRRPTCRSPAMRRRHSRRRPRGRDPWTTSKKLDNSRPATSEPWTPRTG